MSRFCDSTFNSGDTNQSGLKRKKEGNKTGSERAYFDAALHSDHRRLSGCGGDGDCAHLVVKAIAVFVVNNKMEDVRHRLASCLQWRDVPAPGWFLLESHKLGDMEEKKLILIQFHRKIQDSIYDC